MLHGESILEASGVQLWGRLENTASWLVTAWPPLLLAKHGTEITVVPILSWTSLLDEYVGNLWQKQQDSGETGVSTFLFSGHWDWKLFDISGPLQSLSLSANATFWPRPPILPRKPSQFMGLSGTHSWPEGLLLSAQFKARKGLFLMEEQWFSDEDSRGTFNMLWRESLWHTWHSTLVVPGCCPHCTLSMVMLLEGNCVACMVHSLLEGLGRAHALWGHYYRDDHFLGIHDWPIYTIWAMIDTLDY